MTRRSILAAVVLVLLAGAVSAAVDRSTGRPANGAARVLGPVPSHRVMNVSLVLRLPGRRARSASFLS